jgi:DNA modification methylase
MSKVDGAIIGADGLTWQPVRVRLGMLDGWEDNPKILSKPQARKLLESTRQLGQFSTIAVSPAKPDGRRDIYDGHQRDHIWSQAYNPGIAVWAMESSRPLTTEERQAVSVRSVLATGSFDWGKLAGWDAATLTGWGMDQETLKGWNNDANNLKEMLEAEKPDPGDAEPQIDRAAELNEKWQVKSGDLWQIGDHRLLCGDSTKREDVARVMGNDRAEMIWTDPPYGVSVGDKNKYLNSIARSNRVEENLENDTASEPELIAMLCSAFDNAISVCTAGAGWYVAAPPGPLHVLFGQVLKDRGIWRQTIQWVKNNSTFSPMGVCYHWQSEPIFFGWLPNGAHRFYGGRKQTTVWEIDRPPKSPEHPTMKPVELVARAVQNSSQKDEIVYELFAGSGTTIVACQNLARKCRAIEISPAYCAVILERMATAFPGIEIARID